MASVDDRIVAMQFDNKAFEEKIATTIGSLDKLKTSLDFSNSKRGLDELTTASNTFSLAGIGSAVEGISAKFSAMGAVAFAVIQNIVNRAVDAGISIVKAFSLDQVMVGFKEYETNMNAIQTVLANTRADGTTLDQVNAALDLLNQYSDKTIYNFGEMARNIGTFTAAGVDLDTSVNAIKGIANLAAISGSNSQQASTAMYQLSQALASGTVKLMDWNSVVNAGMGGEVFQKALFETGKTLGTIKDVPINQTFEEWTAAGNTFRSSLESGWITSEVLTNTLEGFTGDLTDAQLMSMGYTEAQIKEIQALGASGKDAATKVKTLTQLLSTVKESIGSGWSASFRIIIGDFEQAKKLFTGLSDVIGKYVGDNADARNALLQGWADLGGRESLIQGFKNAFQGLASVLTPIGEAFRRIFPAMTVDRLLDLTAAFREFTSKLTISGETAKQVKTIFMAIFGVIEVAWTIIKETGRAIGELFSSFASQNGSGILDFFTDLSKKLVDFNLALVHGKKIHEFFDGLIEAIKNPKEFLANLKSDLQNFFSGIDLGSFDGIVEAFGRVKDAIIGLIDPTIIENIKGFFDAFFGNFDPEMSNTMDGGFARLGDRLGWLGGILGRIGKVFGWFWDKLSDFAGFVKTGIGNAVSAIAGLGPALMEALKNADWDLILSFVKTAVAAIFAGGFANFAKNGLKLDFTGGALTNLSEMFKGITDILPGVKSSLGEVTGTLQDMQTKLKADALMKIAISIGILALSLALLAMIDPKALAVALGVMAVGFAELAGAMAALNAITSGPTGAAKLALVAGAFILLAGAILILAFALKIIATMDPDELAKGLTGVTVILITLAAVVEPLSKNSSGMITAGLGIIAIAIALNILALALKSFAEMSWAEMAQGFTAVATGLLLIAGTMQLMPDNLFTQGAGLILIATALNILALAVKSFAEMTWEEMAQGFAAVAAGLLIIAGAMHLMPGPFKMLATGAGLLAISVALNLMATALKIMATMSWTEIARGLTAMAGALLIIVVAARTMEGAIVGAIAIGLMALSLGLLVKVLKEFSKLSWGQLLKGLVGLAGTLLVLGGVSYILAPLAVSMMALGVAMLFLGAGFALFGLGAKAVASAFTSIAEAGKAGVEVILFALDGLISRLPEIVAALAESIVILVQTLLDAAPDMVHAIGEIIGALLDEIIRLSPKFAETLTVLVTDGLAAIRELIPDVVATGFAILIGLLTGIRDNIGEIVTLVAEIVTNFLDAFALKVPEIIDSAFNLVIAIIEGVVEKLVDIGEYLVPKGVELLQGLLTGMLEKALEVWEWIKALPGVVVEEIGDLLQTLPEKGKDLIQGLWNGAKVILAFTLAWVLSIGSKVVDWIGNLLTTLYEKGLEIIQGLWNGMQDKWEEVKAWLSNLNPVSWFGIDDPGVIVTTSNQIPATPTITPVVDISDAEKKIGKFTASLNTTSGLISKPAYEAARVISIDTTASRTDSLIASQPTGPVELKFEQNNYSPEALTVADIYRQTRNQITMAKEELAVV